MKKCDFYPRLFRSRRFRWRRVQDIRTDLSMQRYHRITALVDAFEGEIAEASDKNRNIEMKWKALCETRKEIEGCLAGIAGLGHVDPSPCYRLSGWKAYYENDEQRGAIFRRISHLVHRLYILANSVIPFRSLESNITFTLYDLKLISSPEAYSRAEKGLENYAAGAGNLAVVTPEEEDVIRHRVLVVINETRRQTLSLSQLEILRDGVTRELLVASARLIIPLALILAGISAVTLLQEAEFQFATGILLACIGGVVGSFLSAIVRVGKMLDNQDTGRTLILLAGANRSMYFTPMIGCLGALIAFVLVFHGAFPMFDGFDLEKLAKSQQSHEMAPSKFLLASFAFGILAGFSERLVHDLVDRFNKPPGKTP